MGFANLLWLAFSWLYVFGVWGNGLMPTDSSVMTIVDRTTSSASISIGKAKRADTYWLPQLGGKGKVL